MRNIALLFTAATPDGAQAEAGTFDRTTVGDRCAAALLKSSVREQPEPARHQLIGTAPAENVLAVLPPRQHNLAPPWRRQIREKAIVLSSNMTRRR